MNIEDMSFDDFDIDFDAPNPTVVKAKLITIRAYTKLYRDWIKPKAKKLAASMHSLVKQSSGGCTCTKCGEEENPQTGERKPGYWWHFNSQTWLPCGKCAGKGYTTKIDDSRGDKYATYGGERDFSWTQRPTYAPV